MSTKLHENVAELIEKNREALIKASVQDPESQRKLIELSNAINAVKKHDPSLVAAWGLGCGGGCLAPPGSIVVDPAAFNIRK